MIKTNGLTHIHLMVADLERSVGFYHRVFGMQELFRQGPHMVFLRTPGSDDMITLHQRENGDTSGEMGSIAHFGFHHSPDTDLDVAVQEIVAAGGRLIERGDHSGEDPYAYVADPDGYVIEI